MFASELDFQHQLDRWFAKVNGRFHRTIRARPVDRLTDELQVMAPLPEVAPDDRLLGPARRRRSIRAFGSSDYSLDPDLVGHRVEVRVTDSEVLAIALDTGELACRHPRSFAKHRTITALEHARALKRRREGENRAPDVETRSLAIYDQLIA